MESGLAHAKRWLAWAQEAVQSGWAAAKPRMWEWWLWARPHFQRLGELILERCRAAYDWAEAELPVYYDWARKGVQDLTNRASEAVNGWVNG